MKEIRGDKVVFRRHEIASLDDMPSNRTEEALVVHCPPPPRRRHVRFFRGCVFLFLLLVVGAVGLFAAIEKGVLDGELARRAEAALNDALDGTFNARVGGAALRFSSRFSLAIEARDVEVTEIASSKHVTHTQAVKLVIDPLALLTGRFVIDSFEAEGVDIDTALLQTEGADAAALRIDATPRVVEAVFMRLDGLFRFLERSQAGDLSLSGLRMHFPGNGKPFSINVDALTMARREDGALTLSGAAVYEGDEVAFSAETMAEAGRVTSLHANVNGVDLGRLTLRRLSDGSIHDGLESEAGISFEAHRGGGNGPAAVKAMVTAAPGVFHMDGEAQEFSGANIAIAYDFTKNSFEFLPSRLGFGRTVLPFSGAVIDRDRIAGGAAEPGFAYDVLFSSAVSGATQAPPLLFDAKVTGIFDPALRELRGDRLMVTSAHGNMAGSFVLRFRPGQSPEISFGGQIPEMTGEAVKQLWPWWMARKPREWASANLYGGQARNGVISVFIPAGRMHFPPAPVELNENELHIAFDVQNMRLDLPPSVPPLRELNGHVEIRGKRTEVVATSGTSFFGSGRSVTLDGGRFVIADAYLKPLMADLSLSLSGDAAAILELSSFKPMNSLKNTEFRPEDFTGPVKVNVNARFGLLASQSPPPPDWTAHVDLNTVDVNREIAGRDIHGAQGAIEVNPSALKIEAKARVDDAPVDISYTQPLSGSDVKQALTVRGKLEKSDWLKLAPQAGDLISGPIAFELSRVDDKKQAMKIDLGAASLSLPWIGWVKGVGVPAKLNFDLTINGEEHLIRNLQLAGDGFGAAGNMTFNKGNLVIAEFSRLLLSPGDDFGATLRSVRGGFEMAINGRRLDARHVISKMKTDYEGEKAADGEGKPATSFVATVNLDNLTGFNDEGLTNVTARYSTKGGTANAVDFKGVTSSGQAIVSQMLKDGRNTISITSGDAGAFARFIDLYKNMNGGLLNLKLSAMDTRSWSGALELRNFRLANEQRLQSIVSSPSGQSGESLNSALKRDIDVTSASFQRAFARIVTRNGVLSVENGVVRGDQVGATFQGTVRDRRGNMDLTGTFMPAYGLNRLFAELPIIGAILGNGRDRGLIGITFKMSGKFTRPNLTVNPLSVIAPGVFRQIFEY